MYADRRDAGTRPQLSSSRNRRDGGAGTYLPLLTERSMRPGARIDVGPPSRFLAPGPRLGFGAWAIGGTDWGRAGDDADRLATVCYALERGITFFDTAPAYGAGARDRTPRRVPGSLQRDRSRRGAARVAAVPGPGARVSRLSAPCLGVAHRQVRRAAGLPGERPSAQALLVQRKRVRAPTGRGGRAAPAGTGSRPAARRTRARVAAGAARRFHRAGGCPRQGAG